MNSCGPLLCQILRRLGAFALATVITCGAFAAVAGQQKYEAKGKRDPFQNLRASRRQVAPKILEPPPFDQRPPGLAGLLVSEVNPVGSASRGDETLVILRGDDKITYMARAGSKLFDGRIKLIRQHSVVFEKETVDTAGTKTIREETKQF